jgi:hypothetical protein
MTSSSQLFQQDDIATQSELNNLAQPKREGKDLALSNKEASIILGMVARGDKRHDIAAWYGENQARIAEVEQGQYGNLTAAPANELPPRGAPGPKGRRLRSKVIKAVESLEKKDPAAALAILTGALTDFGKNEV